MSAFVELLGATLRTKDGPVSTSDALAGKGAVALYFSAHWCPPCRGFTPKLGEWYNKDLKAKGLEVVFVSSDRDEAAFKEYFSEMPWLALPYDDRAAKEALSKKYKVQGIPTVVVLDADAQVITKDGRGDIAADPTGENFPWKPKTFSELMSSVKLVGQDGSSCGAEVLKDKVFGLYFSAHWCPPCRGFTPKLAEWYSKDLKAKDFEVVFVSSDRDEAAFKEYFKEMPWLALDYADRQMKEQLSNHFKVEGIPSFVIIDKDGSVITKEGRGAVSSDPTGVEFPWYPKPVGTVAKDVSVVNETPTVIAFCETDNEAQAATEAAMTPLGLRFKEAAKAAGEEDPEFAFLVATEGGGTAARLRSMMGLPTLPPSKHEHPVEKVEPTGQWGCDGCAKGMEADAERFRCTNGCDFDFCAECKAKSGGEAPVLPTKLMLLDIPDNGAFYEGPEGPVTTEAVEKLLADYKAKSLERKQLEG